MKRAKGKVKIWKALREKIFIFLLKIEKLSLMGTKK